MFNHLFSGRQAAALAVVLGAAVPALAADYYVVVPLQGKQALLNGISVALNNTSLPAGVVGVPYAGFDLSQALQVSGDPAYSSTNVGWSVVAGALPAGLTLNKGVIAGTPTASGEQTFSVRATYKTKTGEQVYKILTFAVTVVLASGTLPQGVVGVAYSTYDLKPLLLVTGGPSFNPADVAWSVVSSSLPPGLTLKADGTISGIPTAAGTGAVTARASYLGVNGEQTYQVVTLGITVSVATATLPQGVVGQAYSYDAKPLLSVGGDAAYTGANVAWSVASGALPAGLALNASTGVISGTPTAASSGNVVLRAGYRGVNGEQTYQVVALDITVALAGATLPAVAQGVSYTYDFKSRLSVTGDAAYTAGSVAWSVASGTLPSGLTLGPTGVLAGVTSDVADTGTTLTIAAQYKTKSDSRAYSLYPGDPYFAQVAALLKFEGAQGSTTPVDVKGGSFSAVNGASVSTSVKKFGASSAYFPGAWSNAIVGPAISLPGDFTLEAWVYPTATSEIRVIMGQWSQQTPEEGGYLLWLDGGKLTYIFGPESVYIATMVAPTALALNAWTHVAVTRVGSTFRMFANGVQVATSTSALAGRTLSIPFALGQYYNFEGELGVGGWGVPTGVQGFSGYMDDVRVSTVGRYTAAFTPPTRGFPTQ